jgi:hypothetical protein
MFDRKRDAVQYGVSLPLHARGAFKTGPTADQEHCQSMQNLHLAHTEQISNVSNDEQQDCCGDWRWAFGVVSREGIRRRKSIQHNPCV